VTSRDFAAEALILDVVFVLILVTATLGPIMTQRNAPFMLASSEKRAFKKSA
jgi:hypothetical protein